MNTESIHFYRRRLQGSNTKNGFGMRIFQMLQGIKRMYQIFLTLYHS